MIGHHRLHGTEVGDKVRPLFSQAMAASHSRGEAYFANHSLGRMPDAVQVNVSRALDAWLDPERAWHTWSAENDKFRKIVAELIGVRDPRRIAPKTSAGQGLRAVLNSFPASRPVRVVATTEEFDSLDFVLRRYAELGRAEVVWVEPTQAESGVPLVEPAALLDAAKGADLLVFSHVCFRTGQVLPDVAGLVRAAQEGGALVLCDLYHSFCALPVEFDAWGLDFAVGGCYKYARGGAGACWLAMAERHSARRTLDTGWFAKHDPMGFESHSSRPADGGDSWLESTPPALTAFQATPGLEVARSLGVEAVRLHSLEAQAGFRAALAEAGAAVFHPERPERFGAFSLVLDDDAAQLCEMLAERGVVADARGRFARFCPDALTTDEDIAQAVEAFAALRA